MKSCMGKRATVSSCVGFHAPPRYTFYRRSASCGSILFFNKRTGGIIPLHGNAILFNLFFHRQRGPNAGMITTSSFVSVSKAPVAGHAYPVKIARLFPANRHFTCGLWIISPVKIPFARFSPMVGRQYRWYSPPCNKAKMPRQENLHRPEIQPGGGKIFSFYPVPFFWPLMADIKGLVVNDGNIKLFHCTY